MRQRRILIVTVCAAALLAAPARAVKIEEIDSGLATPFSVIFTPMQTRYIAGGPLFRIDNGVATTFVGTPDMRSMAAAPDGSIWITDRAQNKVYRLHQVGLHATYNVAGTPSGIAYGADGNAWFTESSGNKIARLTVPGTLTEFPIPTVNSNPTAICAGPDGALWFVEQNGNKLGRITTDGTITEYPLPTAGASPEGIAASDEFLAITEPGVNKIAFFELAAHVFIGEPSVPTAVSAPHGIALGRDGAFWFTEYLTARIGRAKPYAAITEFPTPTAGSHPWDIASGPDGDLWFAERTTGKLGRVRFRPPGDVNDDGDVDVSDVFYLINYLFAGGPAPAPAVPVAPSSTVREEASPLATSWGIAFNRFGVRYEAGADKLAWSDLVQSNVYDGATDLRDVAVSPDGDAWISEPTTNRIWHYHFDTDVLGWFPVPGGPWGLAWAPDGEIWFTEHTGNKVARLAENGGVTEFAIPTANSHPGALTLGLDGNIWFVEESGNKLASVTHDGTITEYPLPSAGASPAGIAASALGTGTLAITEPGVAKIALFSIGSKAFIGEYDVPTPLGALRGIAAGRDSAFWFVETAGNKVGRLTSGLSLTEYPIPTSGTNPRAIAAGPDGDLWFTEQGTGKVGHVAFRAQGSVDGSPSIDVQDVFYLINYLFAGGPAPK